MPVFINFVIDIREIVEYVKNMNESFLNNLFVDRIMNAHEN